MQAQTKLTSQTRAVARCCFGLMAWLLLGMGLAACNSVSAADRAAQQTLNPPSPTATATLPSPTPLLISLRASLTATRPPPATPTAHPSATRPPTRQPSPSPPPLIPSASSTPLPTTTTPTNTPTPTPQPITSPISTPTLTRQPTPNGTVAAHTVPILMYHYLSEPPPGADAIRRDLSVSPANFEAQLAYLRQAGYETISMEALAYALSQDASLPEKPIILTFDDGHRDTYENAFPLLRKYGYTATFFVFTQVIDTYNVDYLTWEMIMEMHQAGMEFGSHSYRHLDLRNRDDDLLVYEIVGSKEAIEARIGEPVRFFAYPSGVYDSATINILESANFWGAVTTQWGTTHTYANRFEMPRLRMRGDDRVEHLANRLP